MTTASGSHPALAGVGGAVDLVYADNMVEHLRLPDVRALFEHAFVALRTRGVMRFSTPDVASVPREYLNKASWPAWGLL